MYQRFSVTIAKIYENKDAHTHTHTHTQGKDIFHPIPSDNSP